MGLPTKLAKELCKAVRVDFVKALYCPARFALTGQSC